MNLFKERLHKLSVFQQVRKQFFEPAQKQQVTICPSCESSMTPTAYQSCPHCNHLLMMKAYDRLELILDDKSFKEVDKKMKTKSSDSFEGYSDKLQNAMKQSGLNEAYVYGHGKIKGFPVVIGVMDAQFMMGSMGSIVGEKITRSIELATKLKRPFIIFTASGGARMQEGILSLVQMSKTTNALKKHPYLSISVLTHPTTGGVSASFAMTCDIVSAEPNATIGFAGKRVIEQTIKEELPENFQSSEFNSDNGFIDLIIPRQHLKDQLALLLELHQGGQK